MEQRTSLASLITKLVILVILLLLLVGAFILPASRAAAQAASCDTIGKICPTGTGPHAITEEDVLQYLSNDPYVAHDVALVRFMRIQAFTYEPLSKTIYAGSTSGPGSPSANTPALSVTFCGIFSFGAATPRMRDHTGYACATMVFNAQTGEWLEIDIKPA